MITAADLRVGAGQASRAGLDALAEALRQAAARIENLDADLHRAAVRVDAVVKLHARRWSFIGDTPADWCVECRQMWPCATAAAVGIGADRPDPAEVEEPF